MAQDINLLPQDFKTGKDALKVSRTLTRAAIAMGSVLGAVVVIGGGILLFMYQNLNNARQREEQLKNQVQSLEATEQKLVLIKDRIAKAQTVLETRSVFDALGKYNDIIGSLPAETSLSTLEIDETSSKLTLLAKSSDDLGQVLRSIKEKNYEHVELESLTFNVFSGYEVVVLIN